MQYISLPGEHKHLEISCEGSTPQEVSSQEVSTIYITSHPKQESFKRDMIMSTLCNNYRYIDCYEINRNNMIFFMYSNISSYFPNEPATEDPSYSWKMANDFCKLIGKELLYFMQQEELDDFTTMLLEIRILPFVEAVFIGLKYNKLKVNLFI